MKEMLRYLWVPEYYAVKSDITNLLARSKSLREFISILESRKADGTLNISIYCWDYYHCVAIDWYLRHRLPEYDVKVVASDRIWDLRDDTVIIIFGDPSSVIRNFIKSRTFSKEVFHVVGFQYVLCHPTWQSYVWGGRYTKDWRKIYIVLKIIKKILKKK